MGKIDISKMDKAEVLAALYNNAKARGMGLFIAQKSPMQKEEAAMFLKGGECTYFDYLKGRVMKVDLCGNELETALYDRDNGEGAAERALAKL